MKIKNPYVGPRTFTQEEKDYFFGRDWEARNLTSRIIAERLVLFYAQSGAGKSSLINARVIPRIIEEGYTVYPITRVSGNRPDKINKINNIFSFNLMSHIDENTIQTNKSTEFNLASFFNYINSNQQSDNDEWLETTNKRRLLIIDQFEEIITSHLNLWHQRRPFFDQLAELLKQDPNIWILLVMREDYVAALDPYIKLLPGHMKERFYMQRMEVESAIQAVKEPAKKMNVTFEYGVAEKLIDNLRQIRSAFSENNIQLGQFVEPVQLQVVCYQLWENLGDRTQEKTTITFEDIQKLGDVDTALSKFYENAIRSTLQQTSLISEFDLRDWFEEKLITESKTRGIVYQGESYTAGLSNTIVSLLVEKFLLRTEIRSSGTWYELIHDRLIQPILSSNQVWRVKENALFQDAETWRKQGRISHLLYEGKQLEEALNLIEKENINNVTVIEFLQASEKQASQEKLKRSRLFNLTAGIILLIFVVLLLFSIQQYAKATETNIVLQTVEALKQEEVLATLTRQSEIASNERSTATIVSSIATREIGFQQATATYRVLYIEQTSTAIASITPSSTPTNTPTNTQTPTSTSTPTPTDTSTPTPTNTPLPTSTPTLTPAPSPSTILYTQGTQLMTAGTDTIEPFSLGTINNNTCSSSVRLESGINYNIYHNSTCSLPNGGFQTCTAPNGNLTVVVDARDFPYIRLKLRRPGQSDDEAPEVFADGINRNAGLKWASNSAYFMVIDSNGAVQMINSSGNKTVFPVTASDFSISPDGSLFMYINTIDSQYYIGPPVPGNQTRITIGAQQKICPAWYLP